MSKYKFLYLTWLIPAFLLFLLIHQAAVYYGVIDTYKHGTSYIAEVQEFDIKQIAAQTNGYIVLKFTTSEGKQITRKLSLPVEMAGKLQKIQIVPIRHQPDAFQEIVMLPTYNTQKGLALTNMGMAGIGLLITIFIALGAQRYAKYKISEGEEEFIIERIN